MLCLGLEFAVGRLPERILGESPLPQTLATNLATTRI